MRRPLLFFVPIVLSLPALAQIPAGPTPTADKEQHHECVRVKHMNDGDTFTCYRAKGKSIRVRTAATDAPETGQRHATQAKARLAQLVGPGSKAACYKLDPNKRLVCRMRTSDGRDVAELMIGEGHTWYLEAFNAEDGPALAAYYRGLQQQAQATSRGLWQDADPMLPRECRDLKALGKPCR